MDAAAPKRRRQVRGDHLQLNTAYRPGKHTEEPEEVDKLAPQKKRWSWKKRLLLLFVLLFLLTIIPLTVIAYWDLRNFSKASEKLFGTGNALSLLPPGSLDSTDGRVNILMTGYSVDDPGHAGAELTDSILILSLDQADHTGYMLSIPRDLYVDIPDYGGAKINEAYQAGEQMGFQSAGYPEGGMGLLEKVIEDNFALDIHYYALINYAAVRETVDALGGITVNIESDDPRGLYDPSPDLETGQPLVNLPNGEVKLDGRQALNLTRARGAAYGSYGYALSDFTRTQNQQKVFAAIQKELNWTLVLDPRKNSKIFEAAANNIQTDVEASEVISLYRLFTAVPNDKIQSVTLRDINGENLLTSYGTPSGQSALIPAVGLGDFSQIQAAIKQLD